MNGRSARRTTGEDAGALAPGVMAHVLTERTAQWAIDAMAAELAARHRAETAAPGVSYRFAARIPGAGAGQALRAGRTSASEREATIPAGGVLCRQQPQHGPAVRR